MYRAETPAPAIGPGSPWRARRRRSWRGCVGAAAHFRVAARGSAASRGSRGAGRRALAPSPAARTCARPACLDTHLAAVGVHSASIALRWKVKKKVIPACLPVCCWRSHGLMCYVPCRCPSASGRRRERAARQYDRALIVEKGRAAKPTSRWLPTRPRLCSLRPSCASGAHLPCLRSPPSAAHRLLHVPGKQQRPYTVQQM